MGRLITTVFSATGGVVAGLVFGEELRRGAKSVAKTVVRGASDGYQALREDFEDIRAEAASEQEQADGTTGSTT